MKPAHLTPDIHRQLTRVTTAAPDASLRHFPDFLILGPQRTGTTWIYHNLKRHPCVFLPPDKELYYFSTLGKSGHPKFRFVHLEDYLAVMADSPRSWLKKSYDSLRKSARLYHPAVRGEATASYAAQPPEVIRDICLLNPEVKAILMVRDPVARAWSHGRKDLPRDDANPGGINLEALAGFLDGAEQRMLGRYRAMIENWTACLRPGHLLVGDFPAISKEPEELLSRVHTFLGLPAGRRFYGRHLRERINPSAQGAVPPEVDELLRRELAEEIDAYRALTEEIRKGGGVAMCV